MTSKWVRRLLVVEDDPLMSSLLVEALTGAGYEVTSAADVLEAVAAVDDFDPDAALLDLDLGAGPSGMDLATRIHRQHPDIAIIFLTRFADPRAAGEEARSLPPGSAFLCKASLFDLADLIRGIESALGGSPSTGSPQLGETEMTLAALTPSQREVLRLAAIGYGNQAIARARGTSERAVELLLQSASDRLGVVVEPGMNHRVLAVRAYIAAAGLPTRPRG